MSPSPDRPEPVTSPVIVAPDGRPARVPPSAKCPQCGAGADQRVPSSGFGKPHDICQCCAFEFQE